VVQGIAVTRDERVKNRCLLPGLKQLEQLHVGVMGKVMNPAVSCPPML
jgi:hypothetical protein